MAFAPTAQQGRGGGAVRQAGGSGQPWESAAVSRLAERACAPRDGRCGSEPPAAPLIVEGPVGTVLAAVGEQEDHDVATRALSRRQEAQLQEKLARARTLVPGAEGDAPRPRGAGRVRAAPHLDHAETRGLGRPRAHRSAASGEDSAGIMQARSGELAFGAVYEYRDSAGVPMVCGSTARRPEEQFSRDFDAHGAAASAAGVRARSVRAEVVWAGVGRGTVGQPDMDAMREAVAAERAARLRVGKLSGPKPYSRHGW